MLTRQAEMWAVVLTAALILGTTGCSSQPEPAKDKTQQPTGEGAGVAPNAANPKLSEASGAKAHGETVSIAPPDSKSQPSKELTLDLGGGVTMKMVLIPAGKFMMMSYPGPKQHEVTISKPFYLGATEVTQAQYEAVMGTNPSQFKGVTNPVEQVSWDDAVEFCKKFSEKTHRTVRLPTEAEWEYACRAGTNTQFSFGDSDADLGDYVWWRENSGGTTHPVGQKKPNAWGLYDTHGNVWEWCADWYGDYPKGAVTDPTGPDSGTDRVMRGGCYNNNPNLCRSARRGFNYPGSRNDFHGIGFRVVVSVSAPEP